MKIAFMGNANNYPFMIAQAFQRMGHEIIFILDQTTPLDRPENRHEEFQSNYPEWIVDLAPLPLWDPSSWLEEKWRKAVDLLNQADFVIFNQYSHCLATYLKVPHMALLTGTDIVEMTNLDFLNKIDQSELNTEQDKLEFESFFKMQVEAQREAIKTAFMVNAFPKELCPAQHKGLDDVGVDKNKLTAFMLGDTTLHPLTPRPQNVTPRIFNGTRITWDQSKAPFFTELDYKGTDTLIRGIAKYIKHHGPLDVHLVKKGDHIEETIDLITELKVEEFFTWHELMSQSQLTKEFIASDYIIAEMGPAPLGMAAVDAMTLGRPVIANAEFNAEDDIPKGFPLPICQAKTADEVYEQLKLLNENHDYYQEQVQKGRQHIEEHFSADHAAALILDRFLKINDSEKQKERSSELEKLIQDYQPLMHERMRKTIINLREVEKLNKKKDAFVIFYLRQKVKEHIEQYGNLQLFPNGQHTQWLLKKCKDILAEISVTIYDDSINEAFRDQKLNYKNRLDYDSCSVVILSSDAPSQNLHAIAKDTFKDKLINIYYGLPEGPYCKKNI